MLTTLVSTLIVSAIGALSFLAYKDPQLYKKLWLPIVGLLFVIMVGVACWAISIPYTQMAVSPYLNPEHREQARQAVEAITPPVFTLLVAGMIAVVYLWFLTLLPYLRATRKKDALPDSKAD